MIPTFLIILYSIAAILTFRRFVWRFHKSERIACYSEDIDGEALVLGVILGAMACWVWPLVLLYWRFSDAWHKDGDFKSVVFSIIASEPRSLRLERRQRELQAELKLREARIEELEHAMGL